MRHCESRFLRSGLLLVLALLLLARPAVAGRPHPAKLSLHDLHGKPVHLKDLRGKIVVLNFWATWCGPCNAEMPMLVAVSRQFSPADVVFVGASVDDRSSRGKVPAFLQKYHITYPVWLGATAGDLHRLQMGDAVPATAFLDRKGVIVARILGQMRPGELQQRIDWMLHRTGSAPPPLVTHLDTPANQ